jgi:hypothetical protein
MKRKFHNSLLDKIQNLSDRNPNEFWKLVNTIKTNKSSRTSNELSPTEWFDSFEKLHSGTLMPGSQFVYLVKIDKKIRKK